MERLGMVVIGSGPAAVAATYALVKRGQHVTVLDAGVDLEPERQQVVDHLARHDPKGWDDASLRMLREGGGATASGVPVKRVYGSDFPYRGAAEHLGLSLDHVTGFSSLAKGGLSNVWGAAVMPYRLSDLNDWPQAARASLPSGYAGVFEMLPLAAAEDDLAATFPLYARRTHTFVPSPQAVDLLDRMGRHRDALRERGISFGRSRLAVRADAEEDDPGCVYCGMCMYGCPRDVIYKSSHTLDALIRARQITYTPHVVVDHLGETDDGVRLSVHDPRDGRAEVIEAERVFVACGGIGTARLMLNSLTTPDTTLTLRDSQYFLLPIVALKGQTGMAKARLHTLAQVFVEIEDERISAYPTHLQIYTYNDLYANAMRSMVGPMYPLVRPLASLLLDRLMVIQGYLHSNESSTASITLDAGKLTLRRNENPGAARRVKAITQALRRNQRRLGFRPIGPMLKVGNPGQGAHIGGTFPMRDEPGPLESDLFGRPYGVKRIHLVDGSVLPSIPSTTVTLSIMANAYRIATDWSQHE